MISSSDDGIVVCEVGKKDVVIDGLKLTMTGVELRAKVDERIEWHRAALQRNRRELGDRSTRDGTVAWPDSVIEAEVARSERQIEVLTLIRDYLSLDEVYRLGEYDLRFADLLPEDDLWDCGCSPVRAPDPGDPAPMSTMPLPLPSP